MRVVFLCIVCLNFLYAHKLNVFLQQEDDKVYVSAYFASGAVCKSCKVEVSNKKKEVIQTGATNDKGEFEVTKLDSKVFVGVNAGSGHMVQESINIVSIKKNTAVNKELELLREENKRLKREIALLKDKNSFSDIFKMVFALLVIAGIFFVLKRMKR